MACYLSEVYTSAITRCNRSFYCRISLWLVIQDKGDERAPICEDKKPEHIHSEDTHKVYDIFSSRFRVAIILDKNTKYDPNIATAIVYVLVI